MDRLRPMQREEGFTLIEILVVVIIIGLLAAIAIPVFLNQREKAKIAAAKSDVRNMSKIQFGYFDENYGFATTVAGLEDEGFFRSLPDEMTHAVCAINTDGPEFVVGVKHHDQDVPWLVASDVGAVVEGSQSDLVAAMEAAGCPSGSVATKTGS